MAFSRCTTIRGTNVTVQTLSTPEKGKSVCQALSQVAPLVRSANTPVEESTIRTDVIGKVLLKCVNKDKKSEAKTFVLRNIQPHLMTTCDRLSALIRDQLGGDVREKFDVGYFQNNNVVTVRSADDMSELWAIVGDGRSILWCDGLRVKSASSSQRSRPNGDSDSDDGSRATKKRKRKRDSDTEDKVVNVIEELKKCHGDAAFTMMQYRIWAEMYVGGVHSSIHDAPKSTMFVRAGGGVAPKKDRFSEAVSQITQSVSPRSTPRGEAMSSSPARLIENRSKCYKQLGELNNLKQMGLLTEEEYKSERKAIMLILKKL